MRQHKNTKRLKILNTPDKGNAKKGHNQHHAASEHAPPKKPRIKTKLDAIVEKLKTHLHTLHRCENPPDANELKDKSASKKKRNVRPLISGLPKAKSSKNAKDNEQGVRFIGVFATHGIITEYNDMKKNVIQSINTSSSEEPGAAGDATESLLKIQKTFINDLFDYTLNIEEVSIEKVDNMKLYTLTLFGYLKLLAQAYTDVGNLTQEQNDAIVETLVETLLPTRKIQEKNICDRDDKILDAKKEFIVQKRLKIDAFEIGGDATDDDLIDDLNTKKNEIYTDFRTKQNITWGGDTKMINRLRGCLSVS